jgi:hypothetical protein
MMMSVTRSAAMQQVVFEMIRREAGAGVVPASFAGLVSVLILAVIVISVLLLSQEDRRLGWRFR